VPVDQLLQARPAEALRIAAGDWQHMRQLTAPTGLVAVCHPAFHRTPTAGARVDGPAFACASLCHVEAPIAVRQKE
jgi:hypothetical protein